LITGLQLNAFKVVFGKIEGYICNTDLEYLGIYGRTILKWILKKFHNPAYIQRCLTDAKLHSAEDSVPFLKNV
jgi:hypothetical protein